MLLITCRTSDEQTCAKRSMPWTWSVAGSALVLTASLIELFLACVSLTLLWTLADRNWLGTILAFGPRWVVLVPAVGMLPLAAILERRAVAPLLVAAAIIIWPIMGFCLPWRTWHFTPDDGQPIRVLTCNMGAGGNGQRLDDLIQTERPDIVVLQEWRRDSGWPPKQAVEWNVRERDGLLIASRFPIVTDEALTEKHTAWRRLALYCEVETEEGNIGCVCQHLLTPREGLEAIVQQKLEGIDDMHQNTERRQDESEQASNWVRQKKASLVAGDFNLVTESAIYSTFWSPYQNAFATSGWGWGYTKHTRKWGVRIDHILADTNWECRRAWVGPPLGGDHCPLLADLTFRPVNKN